MSASEIISSPSKQRDRMKRAQGGEVAPFKRFSAPPRCGGALNHFDQNAATSSSMMSLSTLWSMTWRTEVSSGSMFFAKKTPEATLPS